MFKKLTFFSLKKIYCAKINNIFMLSSNGITCYRIFYTSMIFFLPMKFPKKFTTIWAHVLLTEIGRPNWYAVTTSVGILKPDIVLEIIIQYSKQNPDSILCILYAGELWEYDEKWIKKQNKVQSNWLFQYYAHTHTHIYLYIYIQSVIIFNLKKYTTQNTLKINGYTV